ncbi:RNA polymerase sigma factor [Kitasatospora sp. NPDC051853]|uniref:RNA polymerase sigma factor n=1 Tax=Kitasatospora sp. NPDC051853 TaxID=3364058 RepID=UPI0037A10CD2
MDDTTGAATGDPPREGSTGPAKPLGRELSPDELWVYARKAMPGLRAKGWSLDWIEDGTVEVTATMLQKSNEGTLPPMTNPGAYLYQAISNWLVKHWHKIGKREVLVAGDSEEWDRWARAAAEFDDEDEDASDGPTLGDLVRVCEKYLTPRQFETLYLTQVVGMTTAEAAAAMDITPDGVRSNLSKARQRLKHNEDQLRGELDL